MHVRRCPCCGFYVACTVMHSALPPSRSPMADDEMKVYHLRQAMKLAEDADLAPEYNEQAAIDCVKLLSGATEDQLKTVFEAIETQFDDRYGALLAPRDEAAEGKSSQPDSAAAAGAEATAAKAAAEEARRKQAEAAKRVKEAAAKVRENPSSKERERKTKAEEDARKATAEAARAQRKAEEAKKKVADLFAQKIATMKVALRSGEDFVGKITAASQGRDMPREGEKLEPAHEATTNVFDVNWRTRCSEIGRVVHAIRVRDPYVQDFNTGAAAEEKEAEVDINDEDLAVAQDFFVAPGARTVAFRVTGCVKLYHSEVPLWKMCISKAHDVVTAQDNPEDYYGTISSLFDRLCNLHNTMQECVAVFLGLGEGSSEQHAELVGVLSLMVRSAHLSIQTTFDEVGYGGAPRHAAADLDRIPDLTPADVVAALLV